MATVPGTAAVGIDRSAILAAKKEKTKHIKKLHEEKKL